MPERVQRKRTKGWRMPANTIYVGRPTHWGNHWVVVRRHGVWGPRYWLAIDPPAHHWCELSDVVPLYPKEGQDS